MGRQHEERALITILAADVVGHSCFVGAEGTLRTLSAYRQVTDALVAEHSGRVFGCAGDSVIAEFACAGCESHLYSRS